MTDLNATADRIVRQDVHLCLSSMVSTLANGVDYTGKDCPRNDLCQQAFVLCAPILDYEEAAREAVFGWGLSHVVDELTAWDQVFNEEDGLAELRSLLADRVTEEDNARDFCEANGIDPHEWEVFEHWAVSPWLAEKLQAAGERVDTDFAGLNVWTRTTTGQSISMDAVIQRIAADVEAAR